LKCLLAGYTERVATTAGAAALGAALLFALHPAGTEAVTYVSGRSSSLMASFYLAACLAYVAHARAVHSSLGWWLSPVLFALALATKESAVSLPCVLLLWEASRPGRFAWREVGTRLWPHLAILGMAIALFFVHPFYGHRLSMDLHPAALNRHALTEIVAVNYLLGRLVGFFPVNIDPDLHVVRSWTTLLVAQATLLVALASAGGWALFRRPWLGVGIWWFLFVLAPTNSLLPRPDFANDRHLYLASVGCWLAVAVELELLRTHLLLTRIIPWLVLVATCSWCAVLTAVRNRDYQSEVALWEQTATVSPAKARVYNNLGYAYAAAGQAVEARKAYETAMRLDPGLAKARHNLRVLGDATPGQP